MKVSELKYRCKTLLEDFVSYTPINAAKVSRLEREIGFPLPDDYREFLVTYGCVEAGSGEIIGAGGPEHLNLLAVRLSLLQSPYVNFPRDLCPIYADGIGNYECLDLSTSEGKIVWWVHDIKKGNYETTAPSFCTWLDEFCKLAML